MNADHEELTIEIHGSDGWREAAIVRLLEVNLGHRGASSLCYEPAYVAGLLPYETSVVAGGAAVSSRLRVGYGIFRSERWPSFLLDLLPQGQCRTVVARSVGIPRADEELDVPILLRSGGAPIGNLRVAQAWLAERERLADLNALRGLADDEVHSADERVAEFADLVTDRRAFRAPGRRSC